MLLHTSYITIIIIIVIIAAITSPRPPAATRRIRPKAIVSAVLHPALILLIILSLPLLL